MSWIYLVDGKPGQGKSIAAARTILTLFNEYKATEKKYSQLPKRALWTNIHLSEEIEKQELYSNSRGVPLPTRGHLHYWANPRELYNLRDVDIVWDEISRHLPADKWADMPEKLRELFAYHRKRGIRIFANSQNYKMCDINFRRMITHAQRVRKLFGSRDISVSLPPVKYIWGLFRTMKFDPTEMEVMTGNLEKFHDPEHSFLSKVWWYRTIRFFFLTRRLINVYDTSEETSKFNRDTLEHEEQLCRVCGNVRVLHTAF